MPRPWPPWPGGTREALSRPRHAAGGGPVGRGRRRGHGARGPARLSRAPRPQRHRLRHDAEAAGPGRAAAGRAAGHAGGLSGGADRRTGCPRGGGGDRARDLRPGPLWPHGPAVRPAEHPHRRPGAGGPALWRGGDPPAHPGQPGLPRAPAHQSAGCVPDLWRAGGGAHPHGLRPPGLRGGTAAAGGVDATAAGDGHRLCPRPRWRR